jgi:uncharacterized protein YuzE
MRRYFCPYLKAEVELGHEREQHIIERHPDLVPDHLTLIAETLADMGKRLSFKYDREADILYISKRSPYAEQESQELGDEVVARLNPETGEIENLEILFFSTRLLRSHFLELPVTADLRMAIET